MGGRLRYNDLYEGGDEDERRTDRFMIVVVIIAVLAYIPRIYSFYSYGMHMWKQRKGTHIDNKKDRKRMVNSVTATLGSDCITGLSAVIMGLVYDYDKAHVITPAVLYSIKIGFVGFWRHSFKTWYK